MINSLLTGKALLIMGLLILSIVTGIILHILGKPYSNLIFTFHKLISLALVILIGLLVVKLLESVAFYTFWVWSIAFVLSVLTIFLSGVLLSLGKFVCTMLLLHKISAVAILISAMVIVVRSFGFKG